MNRPTRILCTFALAIAVAGCVAPGVPGPIETLDFVHTQTVNWKGQGVQGEWVAVVWPLEPVSELTYDLDFHLRSFAGPNAPFLFVATPSFLVGGNDVVGLYCTPCLAFDQANAQQNPFGGYDYNLTLRNIRASASGNYKALFLAIASNGAWEADLAVTLGPTYAFAGTARTLKGGNSTLSTTWDDAQPLNEGVRGNVRKAWPTDGGWDHIQVVSNSIQPLEARDWNVTFPNGFAWGGNGTSVGARIPAVEVAGVKVPSTYLYERTLTNDFLGTIDDSPGMIEVVLSHQGAQTNFAVELVQLPDFDGSKLGINFDHAYAGFLRG